jgi:hypothetical protein
MFATGELFQPASNLGFAFREGRLVGGELLFFGLEAGELAREGALSLGKLFVIASYVVELPAQGGVSGVEFGPSGRQIAFLFA